MTGLDRQVVLHFNMPKDKDKPSVTRTDTLRARIQKTETLLEDMRAELEQAEKAESLLPDFSEFEDGAVITFRTACVHWVAAKHNGTWRLTGSNEYFTDKKLSDYLSQTTVDELWWVSEWIREVDD